PPVGYDHTVPPFHPGTCSYWSTHPDKIKAVIGYFGTIADFFGAGCIFAYGGKNPTLHDAVANTNTDGYSSLLREATAALLNSIACKTFPLKQQQVKSCFLGALGNEGAAAAQAAVFKSANEGLYKS
ncbi:protodermal factor 1-like, partial [Phalaenopsis equestris]|uniref:protodermal factor 1-like n=1 Tax=Phalaenopsis equestris TaxID=78828 RepID=UPI0009E46A82